MLNAGHDVPLRRAVAGELISDHDAWRSHLLLQQLAQQALGSLLVAAALDQDIEHDAGLVHSSPQPMLHPGDLEHDLIQMPLVANPRKATTDLIEELLAEFARPLPHGFVADDDAAGSEQLLHHAETKREAEIKPYGMAEILGWDRIPRIGGASGSPHPTQLPIPIHWRNRGKARQVDGADAGRLRH